jgi:hypothetical protein
MTVDLDNREQGAAVTRPLDTISRQHFRCASW